MNHAWGSVTYDYCHLRWTSDAGSDAFQSLSVSGQRPRDLHRRGRQLVYVSAVQFRATRVTHGMIGSSVGRATCPAKDAALTVNGGVITREDPAVTNKQA